MGKEEAANRSGTRCISPAKLSHAVLRTTRLKEMVEWYETVLNAEVLYQNDFLVFMTYDEEHHRIALAAVPGLVEKPKGSAGLDHLAFFYPTVGDWITTYERLKSVGIMPKVSIHHGLTMSLYYRDPDDNGVELSIDNVEKSAMARLDAEQPQGQSHWCAYGSRRACSQISCGGLGRGDQTL